MNLSKNPAVLQIQFSHLIVLEMKVQLTTCAEERYTRGKETE
jgi:hypothetical protein